MKMIKKTDFIVIGILILAAVLIYFFNSVIPGTSGNYAAVYVDNTLIAKYPLEENTDLIINGYGGGTNRLIIDNGKAHIESASCPDKICANQHAVSKAGETIVCLPNKVVIRIISTDDGSKEDTDFIAK